MSGPPSEQNTSRFADIDGCRLHYHEAGDGPLLLLVHGGAPGASGWGNFGKNMAELCRDFRTVIVDLPGYGRSSPPTFRDGRYSTYARLLTGLIRHLGADKAHLLGMATGGATTIMMATTTPDVVDRLILVSSAGGLPLFSAMPSEGQKLIQDYYGDAGPSLEKMRAYLEMMIYDKTLITTKLVDDRYQASLSRDGEATPGPGKPQNEPVWRSLDQIRTKTLVMWGTENRVQGFDNALFMLKQIPDVEVHLFSKVGLWIPFERPAEFVSQTRGFLIPQLETVTVPPRGGRTEQASPNRGEG